MTPTANEVFQCNSRIEHLESGSLLHDSFQCLNLCTYTALGKCRWDVITASHDFPPKNQGDQNLFHAITSFPIFRRPIYGKRVRTLGHHLPLPKSRGGKLTVLEQTHRLAHAAPSSVYHIAAEEGLDITHKTSLSQQLSRLCSA